MRAGNFRMGKMRGKGRVLFKRVKREDKRGFE